MLGDQVFALTRGPGPGNRELIAYDVSDDAWLQIDPPDETAPVGSSSIVATDDSIVLYTSTDEHGTAPDWLLDPADQSWSELPDDPLGPAFDRSMVWNGAALFLFDKALVESPGGGYGPSYTRAARYEDGAWTVLPTADTIGPGPALVDRHRLIAPVLGCADGGETNGYGRCIPYGAVFDTTANEWGDLPNAPGKDRKGVSSYGGVSGTDLVAGSTRGRQRPARRRVHLDTLTRTNSTTQSSCPAASSVTQDQRDSAPSAVQRHTNTCASALWCVWVWSVVAVCASRGCLWVLGAVDVCLAWDGNSQRGSVV